MGRRLRVFVSSTMKDLANERDAVCERLRQNNFEPVNAEGWPPSGGGSWERISEEIASSDVFVLLLGDRYGWAPTDGPKGGEGRSVTHLEYREALQRGLPVLPFLKELSYDDTDRTSDDSERRDAFRKEVTDWAKGQFIGKFRLARDLEEQAGTAIVELLASKYLRDRIRNRAAQADAAGTALRSAAGPPPGPTDISLPDGLVDGVRDRTAIMFAGAGISLSAGLPSAAAFAQHFASLVHDLTPDYSLGSSGAAFASIAADLEALKSRDFLIEKLQDLMLAPEGATPTSAHRAAVNLFDVVLTTNYDMLFEQAAAAEGVSFDTGPDFADAPDTTRRLILKLHGSLSAPDTLVVTEAEVAQMATAHPRVWQTAVRLLKTRPVVVVGSSLRDPSVIRLFQDAVPRPEGYFVGPGLWEATKARVRRWGLQPVDADAASLFGQLERAVASGPPP